MSPFSIRLDSLDIAQYLLLNVSLSINASSLGISVLHSGPSSHTIPVTCPPNHIRPQTTLWTSTTTHTAQQTPCPPPSSPRQTPAPAPAPAPRLRPTTATSTASTAQVSHPRLSPPFSKRTATNTPPAKHTSTSTRKGNVVIHNHNMGVEDVSAPSPSSYGAARPRR